MDFFKALKKTKQNYKRKQNKKKNYLGTIFSLFLRYFTPEQMLLFSLKPSGSLSLEVELQKSKVPLIRILKKTSASLHSISVAKCIDECYTHRSEYLSITLFVPGFF